MVSDFWLPICLSSLFALCFGSYKVRTEIPIKIEVPLICRHSRSQSCPFCRDSLKRVNSRDLWIFTDNGEVIDMATLARDNLRRLFLYVGKLPLLVPESVFDVYDAHYDSHIK